MFPRKKEKEEEGFQHNNLLLASRHDISKRVGVIVKSYDFSEPVNVHSE